MSYNTHDKNIMRYAIPLFVLSVAVSSPAWAEPPDRLGACREMADEAERLHCYDALPLDTTETVPGIPGVEGEAPPALEQRLQKERDLARRAFAIIPHRPNYILHSYNANPNVAPFLAVDSNTDFQYQELKFQLSLRVPLWNKLFGNNGDLWFGYTQLSFWQAYNWAQSAPFRETNYEPELGLSFHTDFRLLGLTHRLFSVGFDHQSNGRSDPLSRSWNRVWAGSQLERGNFVLTLRPWYRIPENPDKDNNPNIEDYAGRMEMRLGYKNGEQVYSLTLRNSLMTRDNRGSFEIDWSVPMSRRLKGLVQYYNGYAESLIDYNVRTRRLGLGILVEDWL
jgi:phospholipase A1